ncbi:CD1871A family CXXC motif-containing protein [Romboutsia lituseburensis]|nr:CD1871A family CXXC motif-containing protein [Romboutsia lituseburensis]MCR8746856.1 CD1871A family CXXC motif-containing protein [Romboutsia lituseburensis]
MKDRFIKYIILFLSIGFIAFGVNRSEVKVVFNKAINICLECIGIG